MLTATLLLPFIPPIVAPALGSQLGTAFAVTHPGRAQLTLFVSYASLGLGLPTTMLMLAAYSVRLVLHSAPPRGALTSVVLPLDPLGQGGLSLIALGELAQRIIIPADLETSTVPASSIFGVPMMGDFAYVYGVVSGCLFWGFGMVWLCLALQTFAHAMCNKQGQRFGMPWWGLTLPLGVYTLLTLSLSAALAPTALAFFLQALGTALALLFLTWLYIATRTLVLGIQGSMFHAPCLESMEERPLLAGDGPGPEEEELELERGAGGRAEGRGQMMMMGREWSLRSGSASNGALEV
ncbi:hypothetical protein CALCODRAFT_500190 [Calocera cornea HHB12733]|uniref:C4-dicarboxylate transporter/malic acid transport protein n=1 Tax=Calocera cornea HHB12733 TaxID=1353952 RepID=A0A165E5Z3_9BASI|nr:hypothetical protein CALCODRAFT_500190 [Calocera cornea HHB12733]